MKEIVQEIYKSKHMLKHVMALNNLESLEDLDIGDHLLLPISYIIVEENDLGLVNFPTLEIAGELRKNGKIDEADECRIQEAILKPSYDMPTVGFVITAEQVVL
ncbi:MAG: hypothetical protein KAX49_18145 [Halanaerobiales bacterium]|nr:hypothetical protein [Halanaerobiales bacterium]